MQIYTSIVASLVSLVGLFASGEWRLLRVEVFNFNEGSLSYAMTLIWAAVAWQICSVGVVGLVFVVSPLFSNVISTLALCLSPLAAAIAFHHTMNGAKIIAVLMGIWGFSTYVYQNCLDDLEAKNKPENTDKSAAIAFHHTMNGAKIIAVLMGIWGFSTYVYQNCLDDLEAKNKPENTDKCPECSC
nr:probable purine permease 11 [Tanacetum cinerariifolium]